MLDTLHYHYLVIKQIWLMAPKVKLCCYTSWKYIKLQILLLLLNPLSIIVKVNFVLERNSGWENLILYFHMV